MTILKRSVLVVLVTFVALNLFYHLLTTSTTLSLVSNWFSFPSSISPVQACLWEVGSEKLNNSLCDWVTHKGNFSMCVSKNQDIVSNCLKYRGYWGDCNILPYLFNDSSYSSKVAVEAHPVGVYVDVGTNIGSCALPMMALGIKTFMFEPVQENLNYLKNSLSQFGYMNGYLYQCALSNESSEHMVYTAIGNRGNSVLDVMVLDGKGQLFNKSVVQTLLLDDVMWPIPSLPPPHIRLLKLDCQGYEYFVLLGAKRLLNAGAIGTIKMEIARHFLNGHNVTVEQVYNLLKSYNFNFYANNHLITLEAILSILKDDSYEIICKRNSLNVKATNTRIPLRGP